MLLELKGIEKEMKEQLRTEQKEKEWKLNLQEELVLKRRKREWRSWKGNVRRKKKLRKRLTKRESNKPEKQLKEQGPKELD